MLKTARPKLQADTFYLPVANGVLFRNQRDHLELKGHTVYRWIEKLAPYLNGRYTLDEIVQGLEHSKQAWIAELLDTLLARHFLKDSSLDRPHTLRQAEEEAYASAIAYIDAFQESAAYRFERFRERRVLIIGSGLSCTALVSAILQRGVRHLAVLTTEECETNTARYQEYLDLMHTHDPWQTLIEVAAPMWHDEVTVGAVLEPYDTILHVSDRPMLARALLLNRLCVAQKKVLIQAIQVDATAWIGPLVHNETGGCWECAWLRLQSHPYTLQSLSTFLNHTTDPISYTVALPTTALLANLLSFELFKYCTEAGSQELAGNMVNIDLTTLRIQRYPFLRHPLCKSCSSPAVPTRAAFLERIHFLEQSEPLDSDYFPRRVASCFEEHFGLFSPFDISGYTAVPLRFCRTTMLHLAGFTAPKKPFQLTEVGLSFYRARRRLMQRSCEVYAANLVDTRRLVATGDACRPEYQARKIDPALFWDGEDLPDAQEWIWALQLHTGEPCLVSAPLVFPVLHDQILQRESRPGVASGMEWVEAICQALLNWCQLLTIKQIEQRKDPYPQVDLSTTLHGKVSTREHSLISLVERGIKVYDVTGTLQVPTFAFCLANMTITYSTHSDFMQALRAGLQQSVQHYQAIQNREFEPLVPAPPLPVALRGEQADVPLYPSPPEWQICLEWLLGKLQQEGLQAFAIPLDHDPALAEVLPFIAHVLLARA